MSDPVEPSQSPIEHYLAALRKQLAGLPAEEIEEVLRELRGHIAERIAESASGSDAIPVEQILSQLGTPEQIGSHYRADALLMRARGTFSPALIIRTTAYWASRTIVGFAAFLAGLIGYAIGASLIACAILKPFLPNHVGLWIGPHGFMLGIEVPSPHGQELLGWWVIPCALAVGIAFILGTTVLLRWMLRFVPRASRRADVASLP